MPGSSLPGNCSPCQEEGGGGEVNGGDSGIVLSGLQLGKPFLSLDTYVNSSHVWELPSHQPGWLE